MRISSFFLAVIIISSSCAGEINNQSELTNDQIINIIEKHRPLKGAVVPANIKEMLGATHVGGKYYFTDEPYIIEGSRKMAEMGYGIIKLWFTKNPGGYHWNSNWDLPANITLKELAQHPYYQACFDLPFSTIALMVGGSGINTTDETARIEEQEFYDLTRYLLDRYKDRDITFILHNWEGDWVMRGGTGDNARWSRQPGQLIRAVDGDRHTVAVPADSTDRVNTMIKWFNARQRGVNKARAEITDSKCRVYHAIEANKVIESMEDGIPGIANYVLPNVETDMVSWSCYDGIEDPELPAGIKLYRGIEYLKRQMRPTPYMEGKRIVFLGEIGVPEQRYDGLTEKGPVVDRWDTFIGVCLALDVPYIMQWELYCNEPKDEALRRIPETRKTEEMRGFWLIRPDGTKSFVGEYFDLLLKNAGRQIEL